MLPNQLPHDAQRVKDEPVEQRVFQDLNSRPSHSTPVKVKPEPVNNYTPGRLTALKAENGTTPSNGLHDPKATPKKTGDDTKEEPPTPKSVPVPVAPYVKYASAAEIPYTPEGALSAGLSMVRLIKDKMKLLDIGSQLRKDVWRKEIEALDARGAPVTLIAICGATGAGKSSVINAVLDDSIVPTSGMRACTAVVTEISYKPGKSVDADVSFLSRAEWKAELEVLLDDLTDENGQVRRATDLRSEAGVAWHKVHAVYPNIPQDHLVTLTADQIIGRDKNVEKLLGSTKRISAPNGTEFTKEIAKYIDSKEKKRGKKDDKDKKKKEDKADGPALWPLIRTVRVRCPAKALETGAILVDLPGTQDSNKARSSIATDYMQRCQCIWILAPIQRAVDDKVAKDLLGHAFKTQLLMDGNYDTSTVSFIATKTDDLSCNEIVTALNLDDSPELVEIESKLDQFAEETEQQRRAKDKADKVVKEIGAEHKRARAILLELKEHLAALKEGTEFVPILTKNNAQKPKALKSSSSKKRKHSGGSSSMKKRRKSSPRDSEDELDSDDDELSELDSDSSSDSDKNSYKGSDDDDSDKDDSEAEVEDDINDDIEMVDEVTQESLKEKIKTQQEQVKAIKAKADEAKTRVRNADSALTTLKKRIVKAQREKNGFCANARNDYSRDALKVDWRAGVKEMDQEAAMQNNPDTFDPGFDHRDYNAIDLPTFTVSSRDYIRITGQVRGDGDPTCFLDKEDTQIPALQEWCRTLTVASRERAARSFLTQMKTFVTGVGSYLVDMGSVNEADRAALRIRWASEKQGVPLGQRSESPELNMYGGYGLGDDSSDDEQPAAARRELTPFNPNGVTPLLKELFTDIVDTTVHDLQQIFKDGLEEKLQDGSNQASAVAVETSDNFAASMHWASYRAALRRDGAWRGDLNADLCIPLTKAIAMSWSKVFEQDLLAAFKQRGLDQVKRVIAAIEQSAPLGLRDRCKTQGEAAMEDAHVTMNQLVDLVNDALQKEQKEISRCLAPHVQDQLSEGYHTAAAERGTGSVARQKAMFRNFIAAERNTLFTGGSSLLLERLSVAAEAVGSALDNALADLAVKVEVNMSVLWEGVNTSLTQIQYRASVVGQVEEMLQQIMLWTTAERMRHAARPSL